MVEDACSMLLLVRLISRDGLRKLGTLAALEQMRLLVFKVRSSHDTVKGRGYC